MPAPNVAKWDDQTIGDAARHNLVTVIRNTGTVLDTLDKSQFTLVVANDTSGTFIKDHVYLFAQDGVTKIDLTQVSAHSHTSSTTGGALFDIYALNATIMDLCLIKTDDLKKAQWIETVSGTGTIEDATDGTTGERSVRLRPNATLGSSSTLSYPHLKANWAKRVLFESKLRIETASSLALHSGVGADDVTVVDSNIQKIQAEVCTVTNNNFWLRTADGVGNTASDTLVAITTNRVAITIDHFPTLGTPETDLYVDLAVIQKTSNIPVSGQTADNNIIKHSIKNSIGSDRPMHVYGSRVRYFVSDQWI